MNMYGRVCGKDSLPFVLAIADRVLPCCNVLHTYMLLLYYVIICGMGIKCICRRRPSIMLETIMIFFYIESRSIGAQKQQIIHIVYLIILWYNIIMTM